MRVKKVFAAVAMSALLAFSLCGLVACEDNSKEVITESLQQEIESLKNPDDLTISQLSSDMPASTLAQLGLSSNDVVRTILEGFDGTVDSVEVNGKTAQAVVTISCKDFSQIESSMEEVTNAMLNDPSQFEGMSQSEITSWAGDQIMLKLEQLPIVTHDPTTVEYVLNGNTWEPAEGADEELASVIFG